MLKNIQPYWPQTFEHYMYKIQNIENTYISI